MPRALDICAGAGGMSLGLRWAGYDTLGVELDRSACATHVASVGPCVRADVREYSPDQTYDLVAGGVPCQSYSMASQSKHQRRGTNSAGGNLYLELIRIAQEARAKVVVLENVKGLVTWDNGSVLRDIVRKLGEAGYPHVTYRIVDMSQHGVPQRRKRLFVVASHQPLVWPAPKPWVITVREALGLGNTQYETGQVPWARPTTCQGYQGQRKLDVDRPCVTICGSNRDWLYRSDTDYRRMTSLEAAMIQTFPPTMTWHGSITSIDQQIGNAIPPVYAWQLGQAIITC
jgi:DNA (cytosine-5)-methyltransferase 1